MSDPDPIADLLDSLVEDLDAVPRTKRSRSRTTEPRRDTATIRLVEVNGVLRLVDGSDRGGRQRARSRSGRDGVVWERQLSKLAPNEITGWLEKIDRKLTPEQGLRRLDEDRFVPAQAVPRRGRILLNVHGTFSSGDTILKGLRANPEGRRFLGWCEQRYDAVLSFDHPTLGVSPLLNARNLQLLLRDSAADVDIIAHSRGGLVARWWLEALRSPGHDDRAVLVGSPLAGTGLAAPPNIRGALSLLSNFGRALANKTLAFPFTTTVAGIARVITSVASLSRVTPALDAAVALVPGLAAQSRVGNNPELLSLHRGPPELESRYFVVCTHFESDDPGWRFWRAFQKRGAGVKSRLADRVFAGANDLIVDTGSMTQLSDDDAVVPAERALDLAGVLGAADIVHHNNYFEQPETLRFIMRSLERTDAGGGAAPK